MASLAALTGRPLMTLRAGLALKTVGSFVKGLMPLRALVAGFLTTTMRTGRERRTAPFFFSSACPMVADRFDDAFYVLAGELAVELVGDFLD